MNFMGFTINHSRNRTKVKSLEPVPSWRSVLGVAVTAIDRLPLCRLKGDFGLCATIGARYLVHLSWARVEPAAAAATRTSRVVSHFLISYVSSLRLWRLRTVSNHALLVYNAALGTGAWTGYGAFGRSTLRQGHCEFGHSSAKLRAVSYRLLVRSLYRRSAIGLIVRSALDDHPVHQHRLEHG